MIEGRFFIFGLGKSGRSVLRFLSSRGCELVAWDDNPNCRLQVGGCYPSIRMCHPKAVDLSTFRALIVAPGIPLYAPFCHPVVTEAKKAGIRVIGDFELFSWVLPCKPVVAVGGTNGKTTTVFLLKFLLEQLGKRVAVGGNAGTPCLDLLEKEEVDCYVLETSSFQLDLIETFRTPVSVLLNLQQDHKDRHGTFERYVAAKKNMFKNKRQEDIALLCVDCPNTHLVYEEMCSKGQEHVIPLTLGGRFTKRGIALRGENLYLERRKVMKVALGHCTSHNVLGAVGALVKVLEMGGEDLPEGLSLEGFSPLPHRIQWAGCHEGVDFYNDSKATNMTAAAFALEQFSSVYWIAGGQEKGEDTIEPLLPVLGRIKEIFLVGSCARKWQGLLRDKCPVHLCYVLEAAVHQAFRRAREDRDGKSVVLFSPGCASFDQFDNFEQRGETFLQLVKQHAR